MDYRCEKCDREFGSAEGLEQHNQAKHAETEHKKAPKSTKARKRFRNIAILVVILAIVVYGFSAVSGRESLPTKTMDNHIEVWPNSQISKSPLNPKIHRHILEHANNAEEEPGVVINYDCRNYDCEAGLIQDLEDFTKNNEIVYVAPYKNMKAKIVVTKLNRQITLDALDTKRIENFIG